MSNQKTKRYFISFEFKGENFFGSQKQPDKRTVQNELENALTTLLCTLTNKDKISIIPSGRTDAKVSAKYQTAHFDCDFDLNLKYGNMDKFKYHLNCILPDDLKVLELKETQPKFHAQKDAKYKHYRYTIQNDPVASVFFDCCLFYPYFELDIDKINLMLSYLVGYHDFGAYKSASDNPYDDCTIYYAKATSEIIERHRFIFIDIVGDRFLYNMIRIIVGDILNILRNNLDTTIIKNQLETKKRFQSPNKAKANALCLEYVGYDEADDYIKNKFVKGR